MEVFRPQGVVNPCIRELPRSDAVPQRISQGLAALGERCFDQQFKSFRFFWLNVRLPGMHMND